MRELGSCSEEGHQIGGATVATVLSTSLITVGDLGRLIGEAAHDAGFQG